MTLAEDYVGEPASSVFRSSVFRGSVVGSSGVSSSGVSGGRVSSDPRGEHTRQLVFTAIRQLMSDSTTAVTVADIVRVAGISRSSFYAHFGSLDELAAEVLGLQFAEVGGLGIDLRRGSTIPRRTAARLGYERLIAHMVDNFPLYSSALDLPITRKAYDDVVATYSMRLLESVILLGYVPPGVNARLACTYVAGGAMTLISAWMRGQIEASDDELTTQLVELLPPWILESSTKETTEQ